MKHLFLLTLILFSFQAKSIAQALEGVVYYTEEVVNENAQEMRDRMERRGYKVDVPDKHTNEMILLFNKDASVYKQPEKESSYDGPERRRGWYWRFGSNGIDANGYYRDVAENKRVQQKEILNKKFLITDNESEYKWKVTGRNEQIGQYQVLEAVTIHQQDTIQAWFAPQIPVSTGPAEFSQLPGLILRADVNQGKRILYATNIELRSLEKDELIEKPDKGKEVSEKEFLAIREEKMQALIDLYGEEQAAEMMNE